MKLILKWMPLILLTMMSLQSFSQSAIDTTKIQIKKPIARLVIKDLIQGDGNAQEVILLNSKVNTLNQKVVLQDSIIFNLNFQIDNFNSILYSKRSQLDLSQELSKKLQIDLKKQKFKTKLISGTGIMIIIGTALLVK